MALSLRDCTFFGPALPEPFVLNNLEGKLNDLRLLPRNVGDEGRALQQAWEVFRRKLRDLGEHGGDRRVFSHVLEPLASQLGYVTLVPQGSVITREGAEDGGSLFLTPEGKKLRVWAAALGTDLDAPNRRGRAYRFSASRVAQRVLLASGERAGLLTDGEELRLLICDPARPDSHIAVDLGRSGGWRSARNVPDSYRLIRAMASPGGVAALPDLADAARLAQSQVTKKLRLQARAAIEGFLQEVLDHPANQSALREAGTSEGLARQLWREGLILVYRLLFVFKLESSADPARAFSFAATSLWRRTYSPNTALADIVRKVMDDGADSGEFLEGALRTLWRMFAEGMSSSELEIKALGGMLFGEGATPLLDRLGWGERAVARLLDSLLWTPVEGRAERERVHYGALDVEDLGRVYEALLELEPGISTEPMCRLRRAKLEVVVPAAQGAPYRASAASGGTVGETDEDEGGEDDGGGEDAEEAEALRRRASAGGTQVIFIEDISAKCFFLRVGLGRKATGSYYTPHPFVRFLVQETLGPQLLERSPKEDPQPGRILELKVIDPAMGSGHFLVEACRYLGEALYEACRLCDELAVQAEEQTEKVKDSEQAALLARAAELRKRVEGLPDPEDELVAYLPSRVPEGEDSGLSQKKAEALCRRLVAVHCLYGVDKNPLAVELAKLSLWLESYAEGLPLTFMDHRLLCGDSLTGPFFEHLLTYPGSGNKLDDLYTQGLTEQLRATLASAVTHVRDLEASVGKDAADLEQKRVAKEKLDAALKPMKLLAAAWSGGVMLGEACDDAAYLALASAIANSGATEGVMALQPRLREMVLTGSEGVPFEFAFPEVFHLGDGLRRGFDAVLGNPPWDAIQFKSKEFLASFDLSIMEAPTKSERTVIERRLLANVSIATTFFAGQEKFEQSKRSNDKLFKFQKIIIDGDLAGRQLDAFRVFMERNAQLLKDNGMTGVVVPSAFHGSAGATGVRQLYIEKMELRSCFSFENKKKLFDIHSSFKFAAVVARNMHLNIYNFECGFYWHELQRLFQDLDRLLYTPEFLQKTGGEYLNFPELRSKEDVRVARGIYEGCLNTFKKFIESGLSFRMTELHLSHDAHLFRTSSGVTKYEPRSYEGTKEVVRHGLFLVFEGKFFEQYDISWGQRLRYLVSIDDLKDKPNYIQAGRYYRLAYREVASSTNERTVISAMLPPGSMTGHTAPVDEKPWARTSVMALSSLAIMNSFCFDWLIRFRASGHVTKFLLLSTPLPLLQNNARILLAHSALRLSCAHAGFYSLWLEQVDEVWRETKPMHMWPVMETEEARWEVRAAIDAVVAEAYGLDRDQYAHVLSAFSHRSYQKAPELCLAAFDELKALGLEAFTKKHDPYWDIPLNEGLPQPVIDLPISDQDTSATEDFGPMFASLQGKSAPIPSSRPAPLQMLPRRPRTENDQVYETLKTLLQERGRISSGEAQEATGLDAASLRPFLRRLVDEGLAETEGERRGMRYRRRGED
ncbi:Eco57I restriction-modification methylase domain-containing protein [Mesoterricola silvestris]|uniref:site-specific DNA-methyltransferase (adenine-specific) n=1 Tax=Mesoterricola silvestris TaxID=2927979 RepID=A0AA48GKY8_9BACT|nr:hypothetical protein [Mesoterricola silvestris]BDU73134.1 hypothetical protein METEAL_23080 [Mesoterricola silvestris]